MRAVQAANIKARLELLIEVVNHLITLVGNHLPCLQGQNTLLPGRAPQSAAAPLPTGLLLQPVQGHLCPASPVSTDLLRKEQSCRLWVAPARAGRRYRRIQPACRRRALRSRNSGRPRSSRQRTAGAPTGRSRGYSGEELNQPT